MSSARNVHPRTMPPGDARSIRILIAFGVEIVADAIRARLEREPGLEVVGAVSRGEDLAETAVHLRPEVVLFDPVLPGLEAPVLEGLSRSESGPRLLALELGRDGARSWELLRRGASGYLDRGASTGELLQALEVVARGECFLSSRATRGVIERMTRPAGPPGGEAVTTREREILHLVAEGLSSKEIADRLRLSTRTVETHRVHLMEKMRAANSAHLVRVAIREGLIGS